MIEDDLDGRTTRGALIDARAQVAALEGDLATAKAQVVRLREAVGMHSALDNANRQDDEDCRCDGCELGRAALASAPFDWDAAVERMAPVLDAWAVKIHDQGHRDGAGDFIDPARAPDASPAVALAALRAALGGGT